MKRHTAMTASMTLAATALVIVLVLVAGISGRGLPVALAHPVTVDGQLDDWITTFPNPPANNGHVMRNVSYEGEFIWTDASGDNRADGTDPDSNYDLRELRVTADEPAGNLYFLLRFADLTDLDAPYVAIAVDTTRDGAGNTAFGDSAGVSTAADAAWERQIVVNRQRRGYFDTSYNFTAVGASSVDISTANDLIEISMPLSGLGIDLSAGAVVRFTVFVGENDGSGGVTVYGSHAALDAVTDATSAWPSGNVIDYFFDVYFELDGDPTSPLQISEVYYNPLGDTALAELSNEFIELYNPAQYLAYLDGTVLGDSPDGDTQNEVREANFQFPGTPGTGTVHSVGPGQYVVVAVDARPYSEEQGFPDHHWADWELWQNLTGEPNNLDVDDLPRVYGRTTGISTDVQFALGNPGDGVFLADGSIATSEPLSYTIVDGMNYGNWGLSDGLDITPADTSIPDGDPLPPPASGPTAAEGSSLQRDYTAANPDINTSSDDFAADWPTPGFADGLIDHAIYKLGPTDVVAGQFYDYHLYFQVAGQQATSTVITDVLPAGFQFFDYSASQPMSIDTSAAPTIVWGLGDVDPNTVGKITVTVQVDPMASSGTVTQYAYIDSQSAIAEGITANDSAALAVTVRAPALSITKTVALAQTPVQLGDPVTYTIVVANRGDADAVGVHITDTLPAGVTGGDLDQTPTINVGGQVEFTIPGTVVNDPAYYGATIVNTAYYDHPSGSGSDDASFTVAAPVLTIQKTVETPHDPVDPGDTVTYTVVVANNGDIDAVDVHVTDVLPAGVTGTGLDETVTIAAGGQQEFTYVATVTTDQAYYGATIVNTAAYEHSTASGSDTASFTIATPALTVAKTVETTQALAQLGDVVTYTVTVANNRPATATGVVMTDVLPLGVTFGGWIDQGSAMPAEPTDTVTWGPNDISQGESFGFSFTATVTTDEAFYGERITNTVEYDSANAGSGSRDAVFTIVASAADLSGSTKTSSAAGQQVMPEDRVTYTITLLNSGAVQASARITDVLGSYYTVADAGDFTASSSGMLTWSGSVPGGARVTLQFVAQVAGMTDLPMGMTTLSNAFSVDDGVNPVFTVEDTSPPQVEVQAIYLPLVLRNH
jgi:uncharacterized repeat protein (TIGR01451 family)